jgi:hypothetical protein
MVVPPYTPHLQKVEHDGVKLKIEVSNNNFDPTLSSCWPKNLVELEDFTCTLWLKWITDH